MITAGMEILLRILMFFNRPSMTHPIPIRVGAPIASSPAKGAMLDSAEAHNKIWLTDAFRPVATLAHDPSPDFRQLDWSRNRRFSPWRGRALLGKSAANWRIWAGEASMALLNTVQTSPSEHGGVGSEPM